MHPASIIRKASKAAVLPLGLASGRGPADLVILLYHRIGDGEREIDIPTSAVRAATGLARRSRPRPLARSGARVPRRRRRRRDLRRRVPGLSRPRAAALGAPPRPCAALPRDRARAGRRTAADPGVVELVPAGGGGRDGPRHRRKPHALARLARAGDRGSGRGGDATIEGAHRGSARASPAATSPIRGPSARRPPTALPATSSTPPRWDAWRTNRRGADRPPPARTDARPSQRRADVLSREGAGAAGRESATYTGRCAGAPGGRHDAGHPGRPRRHDRPDAAVPAARPDAAAPGRGLRRDGDQRAGPVDVRARSRGDPLRRVAARDASMVSRWRTSGRSSSSCGSCGEGGSTSCTRTTPKPGILGRPAARAAGIPCVANTVHGFYAMTRRSCGSKVRRDGPRAVAGLLQRPRAVPERGGHEVVLARADRPRRASASCSATAPT